MTETALNLWRSVRKDTFGATIIDKEPAAGVLHPDFQRRTWIDPETGAEESREADIVVNKDGFMTRPGGTSLFDREGVFGEKKWNYFKIPAGTDVPESLTIRFTGPNKRKKADHYQIEAATGLITKEVYVAALDNLARNAVKKLYEDARSSTQNV